MTQGKKEKNDIGSVQFTKEAWVAIIAGSLGIVSAIVTALFGYLGTTAPIRATKMADMQSDPNLVVRETGGIQNIDLSDAEFCLGGNCKCIYGINEKDAASLPWILRAYDTTQESIATSENYVLLSSEQVILRKINIRLLEYESAPDVSSFSIKEIGCTAMGGGPSPNLALTTIYLDPKTEIYPTKVDDNGFGTTVTSLPYRLDANESISFSIQTKSVVSGKYTIQVEIQATDFNGLDYWIFTSPIEIRTLFLTQEEFLSLPSS